MLEGRDSPFHPQGHLERRGTIFFYLLFRAAPAHMEVPQLEVELELQLLAYTTATATWDPNLACGLHHILWQRQILNPLRPGIKPTTSWILVGFITAEPQHELQVNHFK